MPLPLKEYAFGQGVRIRGPFKDPITHLPVDPSVVKISYRAGSSTVTTKQFGPDAEVIKEAAGIYYMDVVANVVGTWHWRVFSEVDNIAADEGSFIVQPSNFD